MATFLYLISCLIEDLCLDHMNEDFVFHLTQKTLVVENISYKNIILVWMHPMINAAY
jgi:hypothetical protein